MQKRSLQKRQQNSGSGLNPSFRIEIDSVGIATLWLKKSKCSAVLTTQNGRGNRTFEVALTNNSAQHQNEKISLLSCCGP
jgi:hypothetical protein